MNSPAVYDIGVGSLTGTGQLLARMTLWQILPVLPTELRIRIRIMPAVVRVAAIRDRRHRW
jgi:hypothetical protein